MVQGLVKVFPMMAFVTLLVPSQQRFVAYSSVIIKRTHYNYKSKHDVEALALMFNQMMRIPKVLQPRRSRLSLLSANANLIDNIDIY